MSTYDNEYFVIKDNHQHAQIASGSTSVRFLKRLDPVDESTIELPLKFVFLSQPTTFADVHGYRGSRPVVNQRFLDILKSNNLLYNIQVLPLELTPPKGEVIQGYYLLHICNTFPALDEKAYGKLRDGEGRILSLKSMSLDQKVLDKIPFEQRRIFVPYESLTEVVVHESVINFVVNISTSTLSCFHCRFRPQVDWSYIWDPVVV